MTAASLGLHDQHVDRGVAVDGDGDEVGVVGWANVTSSLNEPPDENCASLAAISG